MEYVNKDVVSGFNPSFKLMNTNRYFLKGSNHRMLHIASIQKGLREFMIFIDLKEQEAYFEEVTGGHLEVIDDDNLFEDLGAFINEHKLLHIKAGLPDSEQPYKANK